MTDRIVTRSPLEEDQQWEPTVRPKVWEEYVGQDKVKENLRVFIEAARARGEPLDHVLLHGPPGLGKTTLAYLIATELQVGVRATSGPVLERPGDVAAILTNLEDRDILFVDEIHRMNRVVEEIFYPAMEDFQLERGMKTRYPTPCTSTMTWAGSRLTNCPLSCPITDAPSEKGEDEGEIDTPVIPLPGHRVSPDIRRTVKTGDGATRKFETDLARHHDQPR